MILLGNRVSVDDQVKMRFSVTDVLIKRGNLGAGQTGTQRYHLKMKAETKVVLLQAMGHQRQLANHLKLEERLGTASTSQAQKEPALPTP